MKVQGMNDGQEQASIVNDLAHVGGWTLASDEWTQESWRNVRRIRLALKQKGMGYEERLAHLRTTHEVVETFFLRAYFLEVRRLLAEIRQNPLKVEDAIPSIVTLCGAMWQSAVERAKRSPTPSVIEWKELLLLQIEVVLTLEHLRRTEPRLRFLLAHPLDLTRSLRHELWVAMLPRGASRTDHAPLWRRCIEKLEPEERALMLESAGRTKYDWSQRLSQAYVEVLKLLNDELGELDFVQLDP